MVKNLFSDELALSVADHSSYDKGKNYFKDDCVLKTWQEGDEYKAVVKGTYSYQVSLKFEDDKLDYQCSCPYELAGACKHVVAAILAFTSDNKTNKQQLLEKTNKKGPNIEELVSKTSSSQLQVFLIETLKKQPQLIEDLTIFLQGKKQTAATALDYKSQFREELNQINLLDLLHSWYREGDDYYGEMDDDYVTESLSETVENFLDLGKKYEESDNLGEALKIYQALFEALFEKEKTLTGELSDLSDCFDQQINDVLDWYIKTLIKTDNENLKEIGINYLCSLFQNSSFDDTQKQILDGLKQTVVNPKEAECALKGVIGLKTNNKLSPSESSLLAFLYSLAKDWQSFEKISLNYLEDNPNLALDLLKYYQENGKEEMIRDVSDQVLVQLTRKSDRNNDFFYPSPFFNYMELEIQIRRFLDKNSVLQKDYQAMLFNLQRLFLLTGLLIDYQQLANRYREKEEKEQFWQEINKHFNNEYEVKVVFDVFKFENQKQEILTLIKKHPQAECFPEMIVFTQQDYPNECFLEYKKKIEELLLKTDVDKYAQAMPHLKIMQKICLNDKFHEFITEIKTKYWRRRRLLEILQENQL